MHYVTDASLDAQTEKLLALGMTKTPSKVMEFTDEPKLPDFVCTPNPAYCTHVPRNELEDVVGQSTNMNASLARLKATAECIERICLFEPAGTYPQHPYDPGKHCINPADFVHFSAAQLRNTKEFYETLAKATFRWTPAFEHTEEKSVLIPCQTAFLQPYEDEPIIGEQISTGAAFAPTRDDTILRGMFEVIERDALMTSYFGRKARRAAITSPELETLLPYLKRYALDVHLFDITSDIGIPTIMAMTLDHTGQGPAINIGAKTHTSAANAALGAVYESIQSRRVVRYKWDTEGKPITDQKDMHSIVDRCYFWYPLSMIEPLRWMLDIKETTTPEDSTLQTASDVISLLRDRNYHVYSVDLAHPQMKRDGWHCQRVIIPELHPMWIDEALRCGHSKHAGDLDIRGVTHPFT